MKTKDQFLNILDKDVIPVVSILNKMHGIKTEASCSGHGYDGAYIAFTCNNFHSLKQIVDAVYNIRWDSDNNFDLQERLWTVEIEPFKHIGNTINCSIRWQNSSRCWGCKKPQSKVKTKKAWKLLEESLTKESNITYLPIDICSKK